MADLLVDVGAYLQEKGLVQGDGIDFFRDALPEIPDDIVALFEYSGGGTQTGVSALDRNLQIRVRARSYKAARERIWNIFAVLDSREDHRIIEAPNNRWLVAYAFQAPFKLREDQNGRTEFAFNLGVTTYQD